MLELYSDLIDIPEPHPDQETTQTNPKRDKKEDATTQKTPPATQKSDQTGDVTTQKTPPTTQKSDRIGDETTQKNDFNEVLTPQKKEPRSLSTQEKIIQELNKNPNLTRKQLAQLVSGISEDGIKYHLTKLQEKGIIRRVGPDKGGHWEVI